MDEKNTEVNTGEAVESKPTKLGIWIILATLLLTIGCLFAVMFAFYDQPDPALQLWGLENYGPFFTQMYGNMLYLGVGTFCIAVAALLAGSMFNATAEEAGVSKVITFIVFMAIAMVTSATICIYILGALSIISAIVYIALAKTGAIFTEEA